MSLMMMKTNPITPPRELVQQWYQEADSQLRPYYVYIAIRAAQWGADQELEACCAHMRDHQWGFVERPDGTKIHRAVYLQQSRRPNPPSLKEQALEALGPEPLPETGPTGDTILNVGAIERHRFLRRALEQLPDTL